MSQVLHKSGVARQLPWVSQIRNDLISCYKLSSKAREHLPDPKRSQNEWYLIMSNKNNVWRDIIESLHFYESICDRTASKGTCDAISAFVCTVCAQSFGSSKALQAHNRAKHKSRSDRRFFAHANSICHACNTIFSNRPRLIAHWSDMRRPKCWEWVSKHVVPLTVAQVTELDEADKQLYRAARRSGHTRPLSTWPALKG